MSDYARIRLSLEVSENSDYSDPTVKPTIPAFTLTPDEYEWRMVEGHTTAVTVELGMYTTISYLIVVNDSSTVDVCATFTNVGGHVGTAASTSHDIGAGKFAVFTDVSPSSDLTLDSESSTTHRCYIGILGT